MKKKLNDKFVREINEYKRKLKANKHNTIKEPLIEPKRGMVQIDKNPPKPNLVG